MSMDLFIYYRAPSAVTESLVAKVSALQAELGSVWSVAAALKRRPVQKDGMTTWMEVYLAVPEGFEQNLEHAVSAAGLKTLIDGDRHIEYFVDVTLCA